MIRTVIVDDEPLARQRIRHLLAEKDGFDIVEECANGVEALDVLRRRDADLMFLDVQMPDLDGFGVLAALEREQMPLVIFVSAYDAYALRAFEAHALDYLLKPFADERFEATLEHVREQIDKDCARELTERLLAFRTTLNEAYADKLPVKSHNRIYFVPVDTIDWIQSAGVYSALHTKDAEHLVRIPLSELEDRLDPSAFIRIHRSTIVRVDAIQELRPETHGDSTVVLHGGQTLRMSRSYRARCQARLGF